MADEPRKDPDDVPIEGADIIALRVDFDLVPDWSNTLERIARHHGLRVAVGVEGDAMVVKVAVRPELRPRLLADVQRYWEMFVERRKREGRWQPR